MKKNYDVIIAGGGTAGCACAYIAGILGLNVLLIEKNSYLGGTMTSSLVTPAMNNLTSKSINTDFYKLFTKKLYDIGGQITYLDGNIGWFNPELAKIILDEMMTEANIDVIFNTEIEGILTDKNIISAIKLHGKCTNNYKYNVSIHTNNINNNEEVLSEYIDTRFVVDGTGDAKIFEKLNLKFLNNFEKNNENKFQPMTLRFIMSGINIRKFSDWIMDLDENRDVTNSCTINGQTHLSTAYTWDTDKQWALEPVFRSGIEEGLITEEDSNYFQAFTIPQMHSSVAFNCPRLLELIDFNDAEHLSSALKRCRKSIFRLSNFLKVKFKGFENAYISHIADSIGVRVSNRIKGKYVYTIDDLRSGKIFKNPCLISSYPVDIHSKDKNSSILEKQNQEYMLPLESLMSADYDNLFAVGRCISADFYSQGALRIIPSCFSMGEGLARYIANIK